MRIRTLLRYLIGDRTAIREIAASRQALWLGLAFVLSAGLAREYDGEDLLHEPWHALIPLGASLVSSLILFSLCFVKVTAKNADRPPFFSAYRSFLTLFWMTAPLAWLYAVPYERFLGPYDAMRANLITLGVVAAWRVILMVRVVAVLMGYTLFQALFLVLVFGDSLALLAIHLMPTPVIGFMGGGPRLTATEGLISRTTSCVSQLGCCSLLFWIYGSATVLSKSKPIWQLPASDGKEAPSVRPGAVLLALFSVGIWAAILPLTQPEQLNRRRAEHDLRNGRIEEALAEMSARSPSDYPPHWEPPPRIGYGERSPHLFDVMEVVVKQPPAPWVRGIYVEKLDRFLSDHYAAFYHSGGLDLRRLLALLQRLPEGPSLVKGHRDDLEPALSRQDSLTDEEKRVLRSLLEADE